MGIGLTGHEGHATQQVHQLEEGAAFVLGRRTLG